MNWNEAKAFLPFKHVTEQEVFERLLTGRAHLWCGNKCSGVTEVTDENALHVWLAGGSLDGLIAMLPDVEAFAKAMHCASIELTGRKGWQRIFPRFGYAFDGVKMVKYFDGR